MTTPKVLHVVQNLDTGAVENWLVRMLRHGASTGKILDWTFYCTLGIEGDLDSVARAQGARVLHSPVCLDQRATFIHALRQELKRGRYDVLHCHHDLMSAVYFIAAAGLPIRKRVVHVHNADEALPSPVRVKTWALKPAFRRFCLRTADNIVGISNHTLDTFLAGRSRRPGRDIVHYYGIDPTPYGGLSPNRQSFRRDIGLPADALLMLFGGRMVPEKNPLWAMEVFAKLAVLEPRASAVFAGSGSLEGPVRERAQALGVADRVRMLGWRSDLPAIMRTSDWFILPRPENPMEGFGLAVVEAQLAGLRLLLSHGVPDDPLLPTASVRRLFLSEGADRWADAAIELLNAPAPSPDAALEALHASPMDMDFSLEDLMRLHQ